MKRLRDESNGCPQLKRPAAEQSNGRREPVQNAAPLTQEDALHYLKAVKERFINDKEKYDTFLEVMKEFKACRIDTAGVIARVKELFKGHNSLIIGFNCFLPKGYEIVPPPDDPPLKKQPVEFDQAINYVNKIKARFQQNESVYKTFLEILNMYRKGHKTIDEVYQEVAFLFQSHSDLLDEFGRFLPDRTGPSQIPHVPAEKHPSVKDEDKSNGVPAARSYQLEKPVKKEKSGLERDKGSGRQFEYEHEPMSISSDKEPHRKIEKKEDQDHRMLEKEDIDSYQETELEMMQRLPHKRKSARRADELIRRQSQSVDGVEAAAGTSGFCEDKKNKSVQREFAFFEKVKARLRSRESYQELLKCLNLYNEEIINRSELQTLVVDILGKHPDLLEGFNEFLSRCESIEGYLAGVFGKKVEPKDVAPSKPVKTEKKDDKEKHRDQDKDKEWDKREKERERGWDHEREREKEREKERSIRSKDASRVSLLPPKDKCWNKPISELNLSNCEQCTPSYRLLPKSYPRPLASERTELVHEVLNDNWVSVTSGSEDYSFKHMRKNQYEESLFRCEDDRFELDMLLESTSVTAKRVGELFEKLQGSLDKDFQICIDEQLTAINLRCIERIYGDHGLDIIELLRKNPAAALPVVHSRLKQKEEEWSKCRMDMNKVWADVYSKNYHKSLDHRCFYFRQQDKKSLSTKGLMNEIKEISEKKRKEDHTTLSKAAGNRRSLIPHLKFAYADIAVHDDLYQIVKYSCHELCNTVEQTTKIMKIWTSFLEPIFGIVSRSDHETGKEAADCRQKALENKDLGSSVGESASSSGATAAKTVANSSAALGLKNLNGEMVRLDMENAELDSPGNINDPMTCANLSYKNGEAGISHFPDAGSSRHYGLQSESNKTTLEGNGEWKHRTKELFSDGAQSVQVQENRMVNRAKDDTVIVGRKIEREEGELSPSLEIEERKAVEGVAISLITGKYSNSDKELKSELPRESSMVDPVLDDEDEGSPPNASEDTENASEAGEEGSESGSGGASHEDQEEDDLDDDQAGKVESEGEAEMDGDEGLSLLPFPDHSWMCKPLSAYIVSSAPKSINSSALFYGNDAFYILFRLHQTLYERILSAKTNALAAEQKRKATKDAASQSLYSKFLQILHNLLDGSADNAKFEDECRAIIGTQSYLLFTLDKLIFKLVKQLQAILADDTANKLLALKSYMSQNGDRCSDLVYHANACVLLQDENVYRIEHIRNPSELYIQLMDGPDKIEVPPSAIEFSFANYLTEFLLTPLDTKISCQVYLGRNKRKLIPEDTSMDDVESFMLPMDGIRVLNGLEYKISCHTSKVSYVLDTEDLFYRRREHQTQRCPTAARERRAQKFHKWVSSCCRKLPNR